MNGETSTSLFVLLLAAVGVALLITCIPVPASQVCLTKREARHLWPRQHIYWYSSDHCWSNRRGPPRHLKIEKEEPKPKKIRTDPIFPPRAEDEISIELGAVTWHMRRPFDEAQPITPPLNLAMPPDDVWPDLSEFERRFVGVQP
jgi:hypothetical protein